MSKARTLANLMSDNAELADGQIGVAEVVGAAPLASPTFTGTVTSTGNIVLGDNDKAIFGAGSDFEIYHDGGGFNQIIAANNQPIQIKSASENMIKATPNGAIELYHDNAQKFITSSTGVAITGELVSTSVKATNFMNIQVDDAELYFTNTANNRFHVFARDASNNLSLKRFDGSSTSTDVTFSNNGSVGINVSNPSSFNAGAFNLVVGNPSLSAQGLTIASGTSSIIYFADGTSGAEAYMGSIIYNHTNNDMTFRTNGFNTAMVIDASRNVLVGKASSNGAVAGNEFLSYGRHLVTVANTTAQIINRTGSNDGTITLFEKNGSAVGNIGTSGGRLTVGSGGSASGIRFDGAQLIPTISDTASDNGVDIGWTDARIRNIYLGGSQVLTAVAPLQFQGNGQTGTYTKSVVYANQNNTSNHIYNGITVEMGRLTDSNTAEVRNFSFAARGGNMSASINADGIAFGSNTAVAHRLGDYEEGIWTASPSVGTCTSNCWFTRIGDLVTIGGNIYAFSDTSSANVVSIGSTPFTAQYAGTGAIIGQYISDPSYAAYISVNANRVNFYKDPSSTGYHTMRHSDFNQTNADIHFTITYRVV